MRPLCCFVTVVSSGLFRCFSFGVYFAGVACWGGLCFIDLVWNFHQALPLCFAVAVSFSSFGIMGVEKYLWSLLS